MSIHASAAFVIPADDTQAKVREVVKWVTNDLELFADVERITVMIEGFSDGDVLWLCIEGFTGEAAADQCHQLVTQLPERYPGYAYTEV